MGVPMESSALCLACLTIDFAQYFRRGVVILATANGNGAHLLGGTV